MAACAGPPRWGSGALGGQVSWAAPCRPGGSALRFGDGDEPGQLAVGEHAQAQRIRRRLSRQLVALVWRQRVGLEEPDLVRAGGVEVDVVHVARTDLDLAVRDRRAVADTAALDSAAEEVALAGREPDRLDAHRGRVGRRRGGVDRHGDGRPRWDLDGPAGVAAREDDVLREVRDLLDGTAREGRRALGRGGREHDEADGDGQHNCGRGEPTARDVPRHGSP